MSAHPVKAILPLFLVLFIDGMGLGIIFPILNPVFMDPTQGVLGAGASMALRNFLYGATLFVFPLGMFFGTPILGDLSDSIGRKKVLLICLLGAAIGYCLSGFGVFINSVFFIMLGRLVAGFTAGSQSVAQAAIIDVAPPEKKTQYLGLLMFPVALGFVAGPLLSGYLSDVALVSWFTLTTPLYFAAIFSFLNALYLWFAFHETHERKKGWSIQLHHGVTLFISAFQQPRIRTLAVNFLLMALGWACYFQFVSLYLTQQYHFSAQLLGLFMALLGLGFAIGLTVLVRYFSQMNIARVVFLLWSIATVLIFVTVLPSVTWPAWIVAMPIAAFMSCSYALMLSLFSAQVGPEQQGWIMGVSMSVIAFGFAMMSVLPSFMVRFGERAPLIMGGVFLGIGAFKMYRYYKRIQNDSVFIA